MAFPLQDGVPRLRYRYTFCPTCGNQECSCPDGIWSAQRRYRSQLEREVPSVGERRDVQRWPPVRWQNPESSSNTEDNAARRPNQGEGTHARTERPAEVVVGRSWLEERLDISSAEIVVYKQPVQEEHYQGEEQELEHEDFDHANYPNEENSSDNYEWMQQHITDDIERERYKDWLY